MYHKSEFLDIIHRRSITVLALCGASTPDGGGDN